MRAAQCGHVAGARAAGDVRERAESSQQGEENSVFVFCFLFLCFIFFFLGRECNECLIFVPDFKRGDSHRQTTVVFAIYRNVFITYVRQPPPTSPHLPAPLPVTKKICMFLFPAGFFVYSPQDAKCRSYIRIRRMAIPLSALPATTFIVVCSVLLVNCRLSVLWRERPFLPGNNFCFTFFSYGSIMSFHRRRPETVPMNIVRCTAGPLSPCIPPPALPVYP